MMIDRDRAKKTAFYVLLWGALWGIFEASVGYALHLLPIKIGSYVWFPVAYFFMDRTIRATGRRHDAIWAALLSAAIKLVNLWTPIRADYVINPAVSIVLESLTMVGALRLVDGAQRRHPITAIMPNIFMINTAWRLLYLAYLGFIAPAWIREGSVLKEAALVFQMLGWDNILSTLVATLVTMFVARVDNTKHRAWMPRCSPLIRNAAVGCLLTISIILQLIL